MNVDRHTRWWKPEESQEVKALRKDAEGRGLTLPEVIREKILAEGRNSPSQGYGDGLDDVRRAGHG